jgi:hypothetical protein
MSEAPARDTKRRRRKFYLITAAVMLVVIGSAAALFEYQNVTYVHMNVGETNYATFTVAHGSMSVSLPADQSVTVELPAHTNVTIYATPEATYRVVGWNTSGAPVLKTGHDSVSLMTGAGGDTIDVSVVLATGPNAT